MLVTEETSQFPIGWLKALAPLNILFMVVTLLNTSQPLMSPLKVAGP